MKRNLAAAGLLLLLAAPASWGSWLSDGKYAGEFLSLGVDARALGMGGAYTALATGASAAYWNPAGLAAISAQEITLMHAEQFDGIVGYDYISYGHPRPNSTGWGFGIARLGVDDIPITTLENPNLPLSPTNRVLVDEWTSDNELAFFGGFGRALSSRFSYGASAKFIGKWIAHESAYGLGFDVGVRYLPMERVALGAMLQDATTTALIWGTGHQELIAPTLKLGGAYQVDIPALIAKLSIAAQTDLRFTDRGEADQFQIGAMTADVRLGLEYFIHVAGNGVALRGGAEPSREQADEGFFGNYTFGAGLLLRNVHFDYAFLAHPELGDTHRVALSVFWGHRIPAAGAGG
jgi:hypothetical protein